MIKKPNNKGFTLVEVVCAVTIMMLVVVPIFTGFLTAAKTNAKINRQLEINLMLENELESIKATGKIVNPKQGDTLLSDPVELEQGTPEELEWENNKAEYTKEIKDSNGAVKYVIGITTEAVAVSDSDDTIAYYKITLTYTPPAEGENESQSFVLKGVYAPW